MLVAIYVAVATAVHTGVVLLAAQLRPLLVAGAGERIVRRALANPDAPTLIGFTAILMWSLLALLTAASGSAAIPAGGHDLCHRRVAGRGLVDIPQGRGRRLAPAAEVWALGIFGLFGYHALYFFALRLAPPAESG